MTHPKGMRSRSIQLKEGGQVMIYSSAEQLILQLRQETPTEVDVLKPSFKVALAITVEEALLIAGELLQAASNQLTEAKNSKTTNPSKNQNQ